MATLPIPESPIAEECRFFKPFHFTVGITYYEDYIFAKLKKSISVICSTVVLLHRVQTRDAIVPNFSFTSVLASPSKRVSVDRRCGENNQLLETLIVLEEFCKELAAIIFVKHQHQQQQQQQQLGSEAR
ncbi:jg11474 [Pararge aegeria aegeria]|uniref:Jg11474 protein n=1 Tax=Pararge aegeria aegeria TaxID=348720 RepID=A0A8S4QTJ7_9NEOP|nr:jg11474 [Pararge aegeria aegeria]